MNSKLNINVIKRLAFILITWVAIGCGSTAQPPIEAAKKSDSLSSLRDILTRISSNGSDTAAISNLGPAFAMANVRAKQKIEPIVPLYEKLKSESSPIGRQKLAEQMLEKINPNEG